MMTTRAQTRFSAAGKRASRKRKATAVQDTFSSSSTLNSKKSAKRRCIIPLILKCDSNPEKNIKHKADAVYKKLLAQLAAVADVKRMNCNGSILKQLRVEGTSNVKLWDARERAVTTDEFPVHYIVTCEQRAIGEGISNLEQLVQFANFPVPSWNSALEKGPAVDAFKRRTVENDLIEHHIRRTEGDAHFEQHYPGRYLQYEKGRGRGGYVQSKEALYKSELMAIEDEFNKQHKDLPEISIEDWTRKYDGIESLRVFKFITKFRFAAKALEILHSKPELDDKYCKNCKGCTKDDLGDGEFCCRVKKDSNSGEKIFFACTEKCEGYSREKSDMGRRVRLCIFRDHRKGWSVRTLNAIEHRQYVTQAIGEVKEKPSAEGENFHDFEMWTNPPNRKFPITIVPSKMGNEFTFINHSCEPNLFVCSVMVERFGHHFTRKCFYADRRIQAGEELTYDYFAGFKTDVEKRNTKMFEKCLCGTSKCAWRNV